MWVNKKSAKAPLLSKGTEIGTEEVKEQEIMQFNDLMLKDIILWLTASVVTSEQLLRQSTINQDQDDIPYDK